MKGKLVFKKTFKVLVYSMTTANSEQRPQLEVVLQDLKQTRKPLQSKR